MLSSPAYVAAGVRTTWTLYGGGRLRAWAAQATGEVERSEGEGRGAAPPGVGSGDLPASWCACSWSFGSHVGNTVPRLYCWMVWWRRPGFAGVEVVLVLSVTPRLLIVSGVRVCRSAWVRVGLCKVL